MTTWKFRENTVRKVLNLDGFRGNPLNHRLYFLGRKKAGPQRKGLVCLFQRRKHGQNRSSWRQELDLLISVSRGLIWGEQHQRLDAQARLNEWEHSSKIQREQEIKEDSGTETIVCMSR